MGFHYNHPLPSTAPSFYEFARLSQHQKSNELMTHGVLLDRDEEKEQAVNLYYLNGFFVEETIHNKVKTKVEIIPYKHGFKLNHTF